MRNVWTQERDEELIRYKAAGLSASKIAGLLHTTRGAILGRSNRLRLSLMGMMQSFWTPERDEELRRHAAAGLSASRIAVGCVSIAPGLSLGNRDYDSLS